jgi:hypothetical protein
MTSPRQPDSSFSSIRKWPSSPASLGWASYPAARLLAEIGDDVTRFADARGLKAYAGAAAQLTLC